MNIRPLILLSSLFLLSGIALADDYSPSFEDTTEFIIPLQEVVITPAEVWVYSFELIRPNGTTKILSQAKTKTKVKPASTMKLFTGWWAFKEKSQTDTFLSKMLKQSVNTMADEALENLGGVGAMEDYYRSQDLALDSEDFVSVDGSGLSYDNRSNCDIQMKLLKKIKADPSYNRFKKLLAQPRKTGTIEKRLTALAGKVFAKTGTLNKTAALSGFVETNKGTMVFCVLSDYLKGNLTSARKKIDNMVRVNYNLARK